jgi:hypothetical protein
MGSFPLWERKFNSKQKKANKVIKSLIKELYGCCVDSTIKITEIGLIRNDVYINIFKTITCEGSTTFFQLIENHNFLRSLKNAAKAFAHV